MLREKSRLLLRAHRFLDILITVVAFILAYFMKLYFLPPAIVGLTVAPNYYIVLLMIIIVWYMVFNLSGVYHSYRKRSYKQILRNMARAVLIAMLFLLLLMYVFKLTDVSRILLGLFFFLNIGMLALSKGLTYRFLKRYRNKGFNARNILIIGSRKRAMDVIDSVVADPASGFTILGCLENDMSHVGNSVKNGVEVIGTIDNLDQFLKEQVVDELIFAMPLKHVELAAHQILMAKAMGVSIHIIPNLELHHLFHDPKVAGIRFESFFGIPAMIPSTNPPQGDTLLVKHLFDIAFSAVAILLFSPVMAIIAVAIKIASPGPALFKQERCSLSGRRFTLYKFRTMVPDAEKLFDEVKALNEADGPVFKIRKDPRIIPFVGVLLRKTGLDELPQLFNILKGEMSFVGPRPPIPSEVNKYEIWQRKRLSMKPGLTCIWQCMPRRNEISFEEWMKHDLFYIDNWSLLLDFKIILKTIKAVCAGGGR